MPNLRLLPWAICLLASLSWASDLHAQRGGRRGGKPSQRQEMQKLDKLWLGVGGTFPFFGSNGFVSQAGFGLVPQLGAHLTEWFSAGPRVGATWTTIKGDTDLGGRQRANLWDYTAGAFARGRWRMLYGQLEGSFISRETIFGDQRGLIVIDRDTGRPLTERNSDVELLIGAGYNPSRGKRIASDIGVFYNLFDDVNSAQSPIQVRFTLTYNY